MKSTNSTPELIITLYMGRILLVTTIFNYRITLSNKDHTL